MRSKKAKQVETIIHHSWAKFALQIEIFVWSVSGFKISLLFFCPFYSKLIEMKWFWTIVCRSKINEICHFDHLIDSSYISISFFNEQREMSIIEWSEVEFIWMVSARSLATTRKGKQIKRSNVTNKFVCVCERQPHIRRCFFFWRKCHRKVGHWKLPDMKQITCVKIEIRR